jgi:hypothetical protein
MSIIRLTDVVTVMKSKWTFGESYFGYTEEFNDNHNTLYPSLLITPPNSVFPEVILNNGWEEYSFEVYFSNLYGQTSQQTENIEKRWDNLQDLATEWLDMVLKNYQEPTVVAMLNDESVEIERMKEVSNDQLLQLKMLFTLRIFTKCFRPVSFYPSNVSGLRMWLQAESPGTFDIATKQITSWIDRSGEGFNGSQTTAANSPLRINYDGANERPYVDFDGTNDYFNIAAGLMTVDSPSMFFVFKQDASSANVETIFNIDGTGSELLKVFAQNGTTYASVFDALGVGVTLSQGTSTEWNIVELNIDGTDLYLTVNGVGVTASLGGGYAQPFFDGNGSVGATNDTGGTVISEYFNGKIEEIIIYNDSLADYYTSRTTGYLSTKYGISTVIPTPLVNTYSLDFDGVDDYVDLGDKAIFTPNDSGANRGFSVSFWIKFNTGATASESIISKDGRFYSGSNHFEWKIWTRFNSQMRMQVYSGDNSAIYMYFNIDTTLVAGQWYHIAYTWDLGSTAASWAAYLDGVQCTNGSGGTFASSGVWASVSNTDNRLEFSKWQSAYGELKFDEVALFDDALSQAAVVNIFNSGVPTDLSGDSYLLGYWRNGDGDAYPTIGDKSSYSNNGTMTNMISGDIITDAP